MLARRGGGRVTLTVGASGGARADVRPGAYRLLPAHPASTAQVELDGRKLATSGGYTLRVAAGRTTTLTLVIRPRRGDCNSQGAGG